MKNRRTTLKYSKDLEGTPRVTIAIPFFNQETILPRNVISVIDCLEVPAELLMVDDCSSDNSMEVLLNCIKTLSDSQLSRLTSIKIFKNKSARYETFCDFFLIEESNAPYIIEVQSDMQINQKGFDSKLIDALNAGSDLIAVSARGVEPIPGVVEGYAKTLGTDRAHSNSIKSYLFSRIKYQIVSLTRTPTNRSPLVQNTRLTDPYLESMDSDFLSTGFAGRIASKINLPMDKQYANKRILYVGGTIMRGPIAINKKKYLEVGGLNTKGFFQGYDEHELFINALVFFGYRVGFTPLDFYSPLEDGSSRKRRSISSEVQILMQLWRIRKARKASILWSLTSNRQPPIVKYELRSY